MKEIAYRLNAAIAEYEAGLLAIPEEKFSAKPYSDKWSKKEELGHCIDSAYNNLRRFIVTQYTNFPHIIYDQEIWVVASDYQNQNRHNLISLWKLLNIQIVFVLNKCTPEKADRLCETGKASSEKHSIKWLADDYVKHMQHHLHHILDKDAVAYP